MTSLSTTGIPSSERRWCDSSEAAQLSKDTLSQGHGPGHPKALTAT